MAGPRSIWRGRGVSLLLVILTLSVAGCATTQEFARDLLSLIRDAKKIFAP